MLGVSIISETTWSVFSSFVFLLFRDNLAYQGQVLASSRREKETTLEIYLSTLVALCPVARYPK